MKEISLTQGKVTIVSDCDYDWLMQWDWYAAETNPGKWCAVRQEKNPNAKSRQRTVRMHREIAARAGYAMLRYIDHWDRNELHNWRENLRPCGATLSMANRGKFKNNTSGFKGVSWWEPLKKWKAYIRVNKHLLHLGYFLDLHEAARTYDVAALKHFGEFAVLNFPNA